MFIKNDNDFVCSNCDTQVHKLKYTSRDHCNNCLYSIHVDDSPGDRKNNCKGTLVPVAINVKKNKGYDIIYKCKKCGKIIKNIAANDDNLEQIYEIAKNNAINGGEY